LTNRTRSRRFLEITLAEVRDVESNPLDEYFQMFGVVSRRELIALREYLAAERVAAFNAHDVMRVAVLQALFDRTQTLLERIEQHEVRTAP
jgi:hypothetical protein